MGAQQKENGKKIRKKPIMQGCLEVRNFQFFLFLPMREPVICSSYYYNPVRLLKADIRTK